MCQILHDVEQNLHTLEIRSDEPDVIHTQLEYCFVSFLLGKILCLFNDLIV